MAAEGESSGAAGQWWEVAELWPRHTGSMLQEGVGGLVRS